MKNNLIVLAISLIITLVIIQGKASNYFDSNDCMFEKSISDAFRTELKFSSMPFLKETGILKEPVVRQVYSPFDVYFNDTKESFIKAHLDNFAEELKERPNEIGYIFSYAGRRTKKNESLLNLKSIKQYLAKKKVPLQQMVLIDGGYREKAITEFFLVSKDTIIPKANPTLLPNEVTITTRSSNMIKRRNHKQKVKIIRNQIHPKAKQQHQYALARLLASVVYNHISFLHLR